MSNVIPNWFYKISELPKELSGWFNNYCKYLSETSDKPVKFQFDDMLDRKINSGKNEEQNSLIFLPDELEYFSEVKKQYTSEKDDILAINKKMNNSQMSQYTIGEGNKDTLKTTINCLSLIMVTCNRYEKLIEDRIEKGQLADNPKTLALKSKLYDKKHCSLVSLLECMYIYNNTKEKDFYCYGIDIDKENNLPYFVLDLPEIAQISVHFPSENAKDWMNRKATEATKDLLNLKISKETDPKKSNRLQKALNNLTANSILPKYPEQLKLHEKLGAFPIKYKGKYLEQKCKNIKKDNVQDYTKKDFLEMSNMSVKNRPINEREIHYLGVALGLSKKGLIELNEAYKMRSLMTEKLTSMNLYDEEQYGLEEISDKQCRDICNIKITEQEFKEKIGANNSERYLDDIEIKYIAEEILCLDEPQIEMLFSTYIGEKTNRECNIEEKNSVSRQEERIMNREQEKENEDDIHQR